MHFVDILTVLSIGAGALIMLFCVLKTTKLRKIITARESARRWKLLGTLMLFFLAGYLVTIILIVLNHRELLLVLIGLVFLLVACFVYLVVYSAKEDIQKIHDSNELLISKNIELHKINQELDQFAYRTSHDLKSPVSSLKGLIKVAELSSTKEEIDKCHSLMKNRVDHLEELIRDILDLSKNARTEIHYVNIHVYDLIEHLVKSNTADSATPINVTIEGDRMLSLFIDSTRFKMIIGNLVSNAMHYADLKKPDPFLHIRYWVDERYFVVSVKDNGVGIEEEYLQKIFDMFFRVSESSTGSGLGLYIVKEAVEKMNAKINVMSRKGEGSEFILKFPLIKN